MPYLGFSAKNDITINATSDLELTSDNTTIKFGADDDVTITHDPDDGLIFKSIATADDNPFLLTIQTGETDLAANDVIGKIQFQAPDEGTGTDANLVSAAIQAVAEGDFSSSSNATSLQFMTGSSEAAATKMTIDSSGNVGIGTTTIGDKVVVQGTASATASIVIQDPTANDYGTHLSYDDANSKAIFGGLTNGTKNPALRVARDATSGIDIDSSGNLIVNDTTTRLPNGHTVSIAGNSSTHGLSVVRYNSSYGTYGINIGRSKNNTVGGNTALANNDTIGYVTWYANDGTDTNSIAAQIEARIDGTVAGNNVPGELVFRTSADGHVGNAGGESMIIDSNGRVGISKTPDSSLGSFLQVEATDGISLGRSGQSNHFLIRPNASTDGLRFTQAGTGDRVTIESDGDLNVHDGSIIIETLGKGINFAGPTAQAGGTSQILDAYEEGTWTPVLNGGSGFSATQSNSGTYTKIGRLVFIQCIMNISNYSQGASTHPYISGLPFTPDGGNYVSTFGYGNSYNTTHMFTVSDITGAALSGTNFYIYRGGQSGTGNVFVQKGEIQNGTVNMALVYYT
jgi:hypothetical protein